MQQIILRMHMLTSIYTDILSATFGQSNFQIISSH